MKTLFNGSASFPLLAALAASWPLWAQPAAWAQEVSSPLSTAKSKKATLVLEAVPQSPKVSVRLNKLPPPESPKVSVHLNRGPVELELAQTLAVAQNKTAANQLHLIDDGDRPADKLRREAVLVSKSKAGWDHHGRSLVVPAGEPEAKMLAESEEDLEVMAHLLEKTLNMSKEGGRLKAAGIDLLFSPNAPSAVRNLYLAGHGALFVLPSPIPLKPEATKSDEGKQESANSSAWDEARRELYRGPEEKWNILHEESRRVREPKETYDAKDVERLQTEIFNTLKEASNMRHLRPTETISVILSRNQGRHGGALALTQHLLRKSAVSARFENQDEEGNQDRGATLLIRVTKANVDALASGSMTPEQFKEKALVLLY